jgi:hypothetical protein
LDDAVTLVLTYAEIPFTAIYDEEVLSDQLISTIGCIYIMKILDNMESFGAYKMPWYIEQKKEAEI